MNLADNLKKLRKENNMSQEDLADKLGVSRQSVSKWESGQAYPEMDKVLQLCKLFNLNINDLLNENITEVKEKKESSNKYNKYVDDFLDFITRTVKLFCSLNFKDKIKLLIEEFFLIMICIITYHILGYMLESIFSFLFSIKGIGNILYSVLGCVYSIIFLVLSLIIIVHIFKIRYLDYYIIVDKDNLEEEIVLEEESVQVDNKSSNFTPKKEDKIIIRDEKHSSYSFMKGLANIFIFFIKFILFFILIGFVSAFIANVVCLVLAFMIRHNGMLFSGLLVGGLGSLLFLGVISFIIYLIIVNRKIRYKLCGLLFIISFILCGIGIGLGVIGIKNIQYMGLDGDRVAVESKTIKMSKDLYIMDGYYYNTQYITENRKDVLIVSKKVGNKPIEIREDKNSDGSRAVYFIDNYNDFDMFKQAIEDLDHKKIYNYDHLIEIHASKENIEIINSNIEKLRDSDIESE